MCSDITYLLEALRALSFLDLNFEYTHMLSVTIGQLKHLKYI
jgi:hypothetical protein